MSSSQISSKMLISQNIRNRQNNYSTTYSNYLNNVNQSTILCMDNNVQKLVSKTVSRQCSVPSKTKMSGSLFIRNYIISQIIYNNKTVINNEVNKYVNDIINIQNSNLDKSLFEIIQNYIYLIFVLEFVYPDPIIEYMIINNTINNLRLKFPITTDSYMKKYITDIKNIVELNPIDQISKIIDTYISEIGTI